MDLCTFPPLHFLLNLEYDFGEVSRIHKQKPLRGEGPINFVNVSTIHFVNVLELTSGSYRLATTP